MATGGSAAQTGGRSAYQSGGQQGGVQVPDDVDTLRRQLNDLIASNANRPEDPTLTSLVHAGGTGVDPTGYNFLKGRLGSDNPWFQMQNQLLDQQYGQALNQNAGATRSAMLGARNQLAATGGMDSGARERLTRGAQTQGMLGAQGLSAANMQNRMNLGIQNEQMNRQLAGQLTAMDTDLAKFNTQKVAMDNSNAMDLYNTKMTAWGANKTADAINNGGKK